MCDKGGRSRLNSVSDAKMLAGFNGRPVAEYVTNARTDASTGILIVIALIADRISSMVRMNDISLRL